MADFVAVIRRAVDGLTDNSPDMRVKVYDKARGAVRRQLEAMNPRPSDELVQRQLDKLEAAISEVESEHAVALPAEDLTVEDDATAFQEPEAYSPPEPEAPPVAAASWAEPAPAATHDEPVEAAPAEPPAPAPAETGLAESWPAETGPAEPGPAEEVHVVHPAAEPEFAREAPPAAVEYDEPVEDVRPTSATVEPEPEQERWQAETAYEPMHEVPHAEPAEPVEEPHQTYVETSAHPDAAEAPSEVPAYIGLEPVQDPAYDHTAFVEQAGAPAYEEPAYEEAAYQEEHAIEPANRAEPPAVEASFEMPAAAAPANWTAERSDSGFTLHEFPASTPPSENAWDESPRNEPAPAPTAGEASGEFANDWNWPEETKTPDQAKKPAENAWGDLEDLIGYQPKAGAAEPEKAAAVEDSFDASGVTEAAVRNGQRPYRAEPRKRGVSLAKIGALAAVLAVVGGAGAAYWLNRDAVDQMVADLTAPAATDEAPANGATDGSATPTAGTKGAGRPGDTEVASAEPTSSKFTQRLLPDGTESDEGPAPVVGEASSEEGKSVAEQSTEVASAEPGAATPATDGTNAADGASVPAAAGTEPTPTPSQDAAQTAPASPGAPTAEQAPLGVTQKMFLYEERLGQSAPTAIDGTVVWSQAEESPGGDAKPEPVIRAQINAPSNGLTAQVTIRRNADKSLPASHLVEIVFALPPNFEGGSIDSVQRVAMKRTEQDRGDPLIAVPAKITEDFHMIALNDFPDAISRNNELLKSRDWIDIPVTYRNGRRALITLEKGASGAEVFNTVMNAWNALGPADSQ